MSRLDEVNAVLQSMKKPDKRGWELYLSPKNRLRLRVVGTTGFDIDTAIRQDGLYLANPGKCRPCGGTEEMAIVQLIRWYRDLPRRPLSMWWQITSPDSNMGGFPLLKTIVESSYAANGATDCMFCGRRNPKNWWSLDGVVGPVCLGIRDGKCPVAG